MSGRAERVSPRPKAIQSDVGPLAAAAGIAGLLAGLKFGQGLWEGFIGLLIGGGLVYLRSAQRRQRDLADRLDLLELRLQAQEIGRVPGDAAATPGADALAPAPVPTAALPAAPIPPPVAAPSPPIRVEPPSAALPPSPPAAIPAPPRRPRPPARPDPFEQALGAVRDFFFGGNTVVRVGVLVLLVGVMLLAKWSIDHGLFPVEARLAGAALIGLALTIVGYRLRRARPGFAVSLQGGGIAALYLVTFFALRIFSLLPVPFAFALFVLVAAAGGLLAVAQRAQPLMVIGSLGGFLAPVLASTGGGNHVLLFSFYLLLNAAITAVAWFRSWRLLQVLAFVCTYGVATFWGVLRYRSEHFASTEPFLLAFMALFTGQALLFAWRTRPKLRGWIDGTLVFGTPLVTLGAQYELVKHLEFGMAWSAAGFGLYYALLSVWLWRNGPEHLRAMTEAFVALALGFGTMAVPLAFESALPTTLVWSLEGAGLYWAGVRQDRRLARFSGIALQVLAAGAYLLGSRHAAPDALPILNGPGLSAIALAFSGLLIARQAERLAQPTRPAFLAPLRWMGLWGLAWLLRAIDWEIHSFAPHVWQPALEAAVVGAMAFALERAATALGWRGGRALALGSLAFVFVLFFDTADRAEPFFSHGGWIGWPLALAALVGVAGRVQGDAARWPALAFAPLAWLGAGVMGVGLEEFAESLDGLGRDWRWAAFGLGASSVLAVGDAAAKRAQPVVTRARHALELGGLLPITAGLALWALLMQLGARGASAPLPYLPLLGPADLALLLAVIVQLASWGHLQREHAALRTSEVKGLHASLVAAVAFAGLNGLLARSVHQWSGVPFTPERLWDSTPLQVSFSIAWTLLALGGMWLSTRRVLRAPWIVCACLLGVTVAKLFFVDLSQLTTGAKIATFLIVGVLLLVIGYLSPVPPAQTAREEISA